MKTVKEIERFADKISAGDREKFVSRILMAMQELELSEQCVFMARTFENVSHFSRAEQQSLCKVPDGIIEFINKRT